MQVLKHKWFLLFVMGLSLWFVGVSSSQELGELRLEGKHIERLVLQRKDGHTEQINRPDETISLPIGEYRFQDVRLKDGFNSRPRVTLKYDWVAVTKDKPVIIKVGAPLKQTVNIERQGPILKFNYTLTGMGGETYAVTNSKHPTFTVFKGSKEVGSGAFEFG
ncbi:MAG: hypothetical protein A2Z25_23200 [Planctomycetes bacterium RBG_16_55_9]|nr:MAG: hypothetical protein A2Z25_23200 [Planctomycetes bacterium RBG_16_55_9]